AGVIAHAEATGNILELSPASTERKSTRFNGAPGAAGVGLGTGYVITPAADLIVVVDQTVEDIEQELENFDKALIAARSEIRHLGAQLSHD
ncbi:phosphoenolpyruvate-utilizing N-terminal domain-containing protein, partial [Gilvimarinus sp. 1_MG-2023]|nr:phosphoenolpyruvate-protein phosphotransferase PtsP [Gilvimarinus sp. 1_MG-2023]